MASDLRDVVDPWPDTDAPWPHREALLRVRGLRSRVDRILHGARRNDISLPLQRWPSGRWGRGRYPTPGSTIVEELQVCEMLLSSNGEHELARLLRETVAHVVQAEATALDIMAADYHHLDQVVTALREELCTDERVRFLLPQEPSTPGCWCPGRDASTLQRPGRVSIDWEADPRVSEGLEGVTTSIVLADSRTAFRSMWWAPFGRLFPSAESVEHAVRLVHEDIENALRGVS